MISTMSWGVNTYAAGDGLSRLSRPPPSIARLRLCLQRFVAQHVTGQASASPASARRKLQANSARAGSTNSLGKVIYNDHKARMASRIVTITKAVSGRPSLM